MARRFDFLAKIRYILTPPNREVSLVDHLVTRLSFVRMGDALLIGGPKTVISVEHQTLLGNRLFEQTHGYALMPAPGEQLWTPDNLSYELGSPLVARVGPFSLYVVVVPNQHDTVSVQLDPPPPDMLADHSRLLASVGFVPKPWEN